MKVVCIDGKVRRSNFPPLEEGRIYTVLESLNNPQDGLLHYKLAEIVGGFRYLYAHFLPTSDIDETEFERNYNKELI